MMKHLCAAVAAAATLAMAPASATPLNNWTGNWVNASGEIVSVSITNAGGTLNVSAKGSCSPNPCDWGTVPAIAYSASAATTPASDTRAIIATFNAGFATKTMLLDGQSGNSLRVHVFTHFVDGSGRSDYALHGSLKRARLAVIPGIVGPAIGPAVGPVIAEAVKPFEEDCISFNPAQVSVARRNNSWKLVQGSMWMLDAGPNKSEMDEAKSIVQHYGLSKQCFVGRPNPSLSYWLAGNSAPSGGFGGEDCININPNGLTVRNSGSHFTIVSNGNHFAFTAPTEAEAKEVIAVIKYYGFTKSCFVGRPGPSMSYLRK